MCVFVLSHHILVVFIFIGFVVLTSSNDLNSVSNQRSDPSDYKNILPQHHGQHHVRRPHRPGFVNKLHPNFSLLQNSSDNISNSNSNIDMLDNVMSSSVPICGDSDAYSDSYGSWVDKAYFAANNATMRRHFVGSLTDEVFLYDRVFVTKNCRLHRFSKNSLIYLINQFISLRKSQASAVDGFSGSNSDWIISRRRRKEFKLVVFGDSSTRGIFCGIARIMSGSEIYGFTENPVCGGLPNDPLNWRKGRRGPLTYSSANQLMVGMYLRGVYNLSFVYITKLDNDSLTVMKRAMEGSSLDSKPDAVILNTGAWDFDSYYREAEMTHFVDSYPYYNSTTDCLNANYKLVSEIRVSAEKLKLYDELSELATKHNIRLIYRNNHYNNRFGVFCADSELEAYMGYFNGSVVKSESSIAKSNKWELFDTRLLSKDHWRDQCFDGFHFDRSGVFSQKDHSLSWWTKSWSVGNRKYYFPHMGELEIQLAHSLLNYVVLTPLLRSPRFREHVVAYLEGLSA